MWLYINLVSNTFEWSLIAKLRYGILQLNVELGSFNQTRLEDKLCTICEEGFCWGWNTLCVYAQYIEQKEKTSTWKFQINI